MQQATTPTKHCNSLRHACGILVALIILTLLQATGIASAAGGLVLIHPEEGMPTPAPDVWVELRPLDGKLIRSVKVSLDDHPVTLDAAETTTGSIFYGSLQGLQPGEHRLYTASTDFFGVTTANTWNILIVAPVDPALSRLIFEVDHRIPQAQKQLDNMLASGELWRRWSTENRRVGAYSIPQLPLNTVAWQALAKDQPHSYYAQGITEYEAIRNRPYFTSSVSTTVDSWYGPSTYQPTSEAAQWPSFIARFPFHPAVDDAAYRLGRCYELLGDTVKAARTYMQVLDYPDGDMTWDAQIRLMYLLDVVMNEKDLTQLTDAQDRELNRLKWPATYELALRLLRRQDWHGANVTLQKAIVELKALAVQLQASEENDWPFPHFHLWPEINEKAGNQLSLLIGRVEKQVQTVADLAVLASKPDDVEAQYQLAAAIYHSPQLFYNHLWGGQRATAWVGGYVREAQLTDIGRAQLQGFLQQHNYAWQAYTAFTALLSTSNLSTTVRGKALFSAGMSLYHMSLYGEDTYYWMPATELRELLVATFNEYVTRYPDSALADDALLMVGIYSRKKESLTELLRAYPQGDKAATAKQILAKWDDEYFLDSDPLLSRLPTDAKSP